MLLLRAGDRGILVDFDEISFEALHAVREAARRLPGVVAAIAGNKSVLVLAASATDIPAIGDAVRAALRDSRSLDAASGREHILDVSFAADDAPDLDLLVSTAGASRSEVIDGIARLRFRARYLGFLPGFAYLEGVPAEWSLPRRATSRLFVPRGSFGLAGALAGLYAIESPGGWNIIGRTSADLWNESRTPPNLIAPGDTVRIRPVDHLGPASSPHEPEPPSAGTVVANVLESGQATLIVGGSADTSRLDFGLPAGGVFDVETASAANTLVGNAPEAACLEIYLVGPKLEFKARTLVAWAGAGCRLMLNGRDCSSPLEVRSGDVLTIGRLQRGARGWLAINGGLVDPSPRFSWKPSRIQRGDELRAHEGQPGPMPPAAISVSRTVQQEIVVLSGPHAVSADRRRFLQTATWTVSANSDRTGVRLTPSIAAPPADSLLPSCGMQPGTAQWHPNGDIVLMGPDHPITGGYLQPMTVIDDDLWKIAQLSPGDVVRFVTRSSPGLE